MRTLFVFSVAVLFPSLAMAWDDTAEGVNLSGSTELYRGVEYSLWLPSQDSMVAVQFRADTRGDLDVSHLVNSSIDWDGENLTHWFSGIEDGGLQNLSQDTSLAANIHLDVFGYNLTANVWEETFAWKGESVFDTALIPQGWATSTVVAEADQLVALDTAFEVMEGVQLLISGEVVPTSRVVLSGTHMTVNGKQVTELDWADDVALPAVNNGTMPMQASWSGLANATFGVDLRPTVGACIDDFGCLDFPFSYTWTMASETVNVDTETTAYRHNMPAVGMVDATVNVGTVTLGESATVAVSMENLGLVTLEGYAVVEGEGFTLETNELFAEVGDLASVVLTFTPEVEGQVVGGITFYTNDPLRPEVYVPVSGTGVAPELDIDPTVDGDGDGITDPNLATGCGCNATSTGPQGTLAGMGLIGLLLLRRRRA